MTTMFDDAYIHTIGQIETFLDAADVFALQLQCPKREKAQWIYERLVRFRYSRLRKREKNIVCRYVRLLSGCSSRQIKRYVRAYKNGRKLCRPYERRTFSVTYTDADRELLAETDNLHSAIDRRTSAAAIQRICHKEYAMGNRKYERLARISVSHLANLRRSKRYRHIAVTVEKTKTVQRSIGRRGKPDPQGKPGFLRVDTVHQGDAPNGSKGVYHVNLVDEVTQWEIILSVDQIAESSLKPALEIALELFPFTILGFHSDNGSEYINAFVARLLLGMGVEQTKGRSRHCNDNALIESKNGSAVRKWWGHAFIHRSFANRLNIVNVEYLMPYLNFHHPCAFAVETVAPNGKRRKKYPHGQYKTPLEKFLSLENPAQYLRPCATLESLKKWAAEKTPNQAARALQEARRKTFGIVLDASATMSSTETSKSIISGPSSD
jgi:transposase InsO family protein